MPAIAATGLDSDGVTLIAPNSADFDSLVAKIMNNEAAGPALWLKPYLVIVSNQTSRTVVAYDILWKLRYKDGRSEQSFVQFKYPDALAGAADTGMHSAHESPQPLLPGKQKLSAMSLEFGPEIVALPGWEEFLRDGTRNRTSEFADVVKIEIELDAAIFDDGVLVGKDAGNLGSHFAAYVEAKQKLFHSVVAGLEAKQSTDEVFAPIKAAAEIEPGKAAKRMAGDPLALYSMLAAEEILGLRSRIGDQAVYSFFKNAIRKEPFVVRRRSTESQGGK